MKTAVLYRSLTGHSKKLAKAVAAHFGVEAQSIKEKPVLEGVDLMFFAGGIYSGQSWKDTPEYLKTINGKAVKKAALITSSATCKVKQDEVRKILTENGVQVFDEEYCCYGNFLFIKAGHPNKKEIAGAVEFAKQCAEKFK